MVFSVDEPCCCSESVATTASVRSGTLSVAVSKLNGENMELDVAWDESVAAFKMRLRQIHDVAVCKQLLICGACELKNGHELGSYVDRAPLVVTLLVREKIPEEVMCNTKKLLTALHDGMAPRPCQLKTVVFRPKTLFVRQTPMCGVPAPHEQSSQLCIHTKARKLVPGRTPAARKLREQRRKVLALELQSKVLKTPAKIFRKGFRRRLLQDSYERVSWAGLDADIERTNRD